MFAFVLLVSIHHPAVAPTVTAPLLLMLHEDGVVHASAWNWNVTLLACLGLAAAIYAVGVTRAWRRAGFGQGIRPRQAACYAGGIASLIIALISPLDRVSEVLFSAHMVQHLILLLVAAPLLVLGAPTLALLWALPSRRRQKALEKWRSEALWSGTWGLLSHPLTVWTLYAVILWAWHLPGAFEAALHSDVIHDIQHASFLVAAALFWWTVISPLGRRRLDSGAGLLYLFTTSLHGSALGLLLTFSSNPWYGEYIRRAPGDESAMQDQQLAGLIMWMPVGILFVLLAAVICLAWLRRIERRMPSGE